MNGPELVIVAVVLGGTAGFLSALKLVGYGMRSGLAQIVRLWRYRHGTCTCHLCK